MVQAGSSVLAASAARAGAEKADPPKGPKQYRVIDTHLHLFNTRLEGTPGVPAYLEASTEANVAWYRHHGFEVQHEVRPVPAGPPVWTMWREPKT